MKLRSILYIIGIAVVVALSACTADDSFTTSKSNLLTFSNDSISLDTTFSNVPTTTRSFWVYNHSGDGIRLSSVRLENGNQSGFRVNVDGAYLGKTVGYQAQNVEVRDGDSIRIFVELTSPVQHADNPQLVMDNLIFAYESGVVQKVNLNAYSWDAIRVNHLEIKNDTTISTSKPVVVYGGMTVDSTATLTLGAGTTLYFHEDAGLNVYGTLKSEGTAEKNVVLRGDRIDNMFDYLPYDRTPGQWQGIHFYGSSYDNSIVYTDLHSAYTGILCDSSDVNRNKLLLQQSTVHNCMGDGVSATSCQIDIENSLLSNTLGDCAVFKGGDISIMNTTMAQFYPYSSNRGAAIRFGSSPVMLTDFTVSNSLITGYAEDVMEGEGLDSTSYSFDHCIIRTPPIKSVDSIHFTNVIYENIKDTTKYGEKNFRKIDTGNLVYDFRLDSISPAIDAANASTSLRLDRDGRDRTGKPDIGCYEYIK